MNRNPYTTELEQWSKELETLLRTSRIRLEICLGRMRACTEEPQSHEVSMEEIPAWCDEISELLGDRIQVQGKHTELAKLIAKAERTMHDALLQLAEWLKENHKVLTKNSNGKPEITQQEWADILLVLKAKLASPTVKGRDRESVAWRKNLRDVIESVTNGEYDEINDADWTEIYYALDSADNGGEALMEKIGPDGKRMWTGPGVDRG